MSFREVLDKIPDYKDFMTVEELNTSNQALVEEFKDVKLKYLGKTAEGRPIQCLEIGNGSRSALLFAFPHPNEPIGSLTVEFLSRFLAEKS